MKNAIILVLIWTMIGFLAGVLVLKLWPGNDRLIVSGVIACNAPDKKG